MRGADFAVLGLICAFWCGSFGLIFGRSGSGKTTLVQVVFWCYVMFIFFFKQCIVYELFFFPFQLLAGMSKPTSGSIYIQKYGNDGNPVQSPEPLSAGRVGIVFQFPERYWILVTKLKNCFLSRLIMIRVHNYKIELPYGPISLIVCVMSVHLRFF